MRAAGRLNPGSSRSAQVRQSRPLRQPPFDWFFCEHFPVTPELQERAEKVLGYVFKNKSLLKEALTHSSIADNRLQSNERMEFLGDAVLDLIVCEALYKKFPEYNEGDLTKIKSAVVSRRTCAEVSNETRLSDLLI